MWKYAIAAAALVLWAPPAEAQSISETLAAQSRQPRAHPADTKGIDLGRIQVQLWYEETGRLSADITPPAEFITWNTIIGEGQAEEIANDVLMTVEVLSSGREENVDIPLTMEVRDSEGRIVATRTVASVLTSPQGRSVKGLWVPDIGCAGEITFRAQLGRLSRRVELNFPCGE